MSNLPIELQKLYFEEVKGCRLCCECPGIAERANESVSVTRRFMFHWLPCKVGEPPLRYVFLAMEPSFTGVKEGLEYPDEGGFHGGLRFAIKKFLFQGRENENYLITNLGKCTIAGNLARKTRAFRWEKCSSYLEKECKAVEAVSASVGFIAIGRDPVKFIVSHQDLYGRFFAGRHIHYLMHYSPQNNQRFKKFAMERETEYQEFKLREDTPLENFLGEEAKEDLQRFERDRDPWLYRIFMWSHQMGEILKG